MNLAHHVKLLGVKIQ